MAFGALNVVTPEAQVERDRFRESSDVLCGTGRETSAAGNRSVFFHACALLLWPNGLKCHARTGTWRLIPGSHWRRLGSFRETAEAESIFLHQQRGHCYFSCARIFERPFCVR